jgi:glycosyltransferase involved in cell wall biosynthesis
MRRRGYDSRTFARRVARINRREDFDVHRDEFLRGWPRADAVRDFIVFSWAIHHADVFLWYFDGGYLKPTALRWLEPTLLRLAGKKIVVFPYGGDIAVLGEIGVAEESLLSDYPDLVLTSEATRRQVLHLCRWADLVIRNYQWGFLPRADVFWPTQIAIDVDDWAPQGVASRADGRTGEVVVVHAPNHRHVKGTQSLIEAISELRSDGLKVRLELLEGRPNEEVRNVVRRCDIVADQFVAGYALFAIEGMSAGKPVMSALSWMPEDLRTSVALRECPIVDADVSNLAVQLRALVENPDRRAELGRAGREYVRKYHAYEPVARTWADLIDHVWAGAPVPQALKLPV